MRLGPHRERAHRLVDPGRAPVVDRAERLGRHIARREAGAARDEHELDRVGRIRETGLTILVVEQNTVLALAVANRGYVLETGRVVLAGSADELRRSERVREAYLGR